MPETSLQGMVMSEDYADLILPIQTSDEMFLETYQAMGAQIFGARLGAIHAPLTSRNMWESISYSQIPKLYTLLDTTSLEASGILRVQSQPSLGYEGENVLIGFIDTGIDYTLDVFRTSDGRTRILGIWDQNLPSENPPYTMGYGAAYTSAEINAALVSQDPLAIVPAGDPDGHGTYLAGVATGSADTVHSFIGAAPKSAIAMVKLKPAKQYLKDYFLIREDAIAYQETDIMMGLRYLLSLSVDYQLPLVICLGLGTNQGDHNGSSPLDRLLNFFVDYQGCFCVVAGGNEAGMAHHFYNDSDMFSEQSVTEILVDPVDTGFCLEIWADSPSLYGVSITSPLGEVIPRIPPRQGLSSLYNFVAERTILEIKYEIAEYSSGAQLIFLRFINPTPGIWRLTVSNTGQPLGSYHMWLPITGFISDGTVFLSPNPYTTLTSPSAADSVITVSTYNAYTGSLYIRSSRGFTRNNAIKPDLAAPGVEVYGPATSSGKTLPLLTPFIRVSGSCAAAAITAGAVALLINWSFDRSYPFSGIISNRSIKNYLTRGAIRQPGQSYPNREWGYGTLNLYHVFESLM